MSAAPPAGGDAAGLAPGARVEEYEVQRVLGSGGFGITYLARDTHLDLTVALKEYFPGELLTRGSDGRVTPRTGDLAARQRFAAGLQRFLDEARALASFRHPHIVRALRYFRALGTGYIVMDYESGLPLKQWLARHQPLDLAGLLSVVRPLLDGLEAVHTAGFLHRDVKPDNIHIRADGSPVLLDFGAARRVLADGEMTNIVSPGFAPFEQYHARGAQGPWTDLYALGAVMYWMVTGHKPLEAAARIQADPMPGAASLGDAAVFGLPLLQAIDWALQPDEQRRPQAVAQFRAALEGDGSSRPGAAEAAALAPGLPCASEPGLAALRKRNLLCTILFIDLVGYSARSVNEQAAAKRLLNDRIARAIDPVDAQTRLAIDTGDGAALCFLDDPEEALQAALQLRDSLQLPGTGALPARMGLHLGPVRVVQDINRRLNVIGDGINVAQRVMDFAQPGELLVSRACHDVISRLAEGAAALFRPAGTRTDKHGRHHELLAVVEAPPTGLAGDGDDTLPLREAAPALDDAGAREIEAELARRIGPMARVLVEKARRRAGTATRLREALAPLVPDPAARAAFLRGPTAWGPTAPDTPGLAAPRPLSAERSHPPAGLSVREADPLPGLRPTAGAALEAVEQALVRHVGPMARLLVRQQLAAGADAATLVDALAAHIAPPDQREAFRVLARRVLGGG